MREDKEREKRIAVLEAMILQAANMEACEGRCPDISGCPKDVDCGACWVRYWRQCAEDSGTFQNGNNHGTTSKMETVGEASK